MVLEFEVISSKASSTAALRDPAPCTTTVALVPREEATAAGTIDVRFDSFRSTSATALGGTPGVTALSGVTRRSELYGRPPTAVAMAFDTIPASLVLTAAAGTVHR